MQRPGLIILFLIQFAGWYWVHINLPFLGATRGPQVGSGANPSTLLASFDATPIHKETYLRFNLDTRQWRSLNRRQAFPEFKPTSDAEAYWQLMSPSKSGGPFAVEQFQRDTLQVLQRLELPFYENSPGLLRAARIVNNRFVVQITTSSIDWIDLTEPSTKLRSLARPADPNMAIHDIVEGDHASFIVLESSNYLHSKPTHAQLYRAADTGQLQQVAAWEMALVTDSVAVWNGKVASLGRLNRELEVRSLVDGRLLWQTELPSNFAANDWMMTRSIHLKTVLALRNNGGSGYYDLDTGRYLTQPDKSALLIDALPDRSLLLYQLASGAYCVFDPVKEQRLLTYAARRGSEVHLRDHQTSTIVDRAFGLSFYKFDHATGTVIERYRPFLVAICVTWVLVGLFFVWAWQWLKLSCRQVYTLERFDLTKDAVPLIALPLLVGSWRLATCGTIAVDRPAYQLTVALFNGLVLLLLVWLIGGPQTFRYRLRAAWPLLVVPPVVLGLLMRELQWSSPLLQALYAPAIIAALYFQLLKMLGWRSYRSRETVDLKSITLLDYFILTMFVGILLGYLNIPQPVLGAANHRRYMLTVAVAGQLLMVHLATSGLRVRFRLGSAIASVGMCIWSIQFLWPMISGNWMPPKPQLVSEVQTITFMLAISFAALAVSFEVAHLGAHSRRRL